jgi:hypothetical protein
MDTFKMVETDFSLELSFSIFAVTVTGFLLWRRHTVENDYIPEEGNRINELT